MRTRLSILLALVLAGCPADDDDASDDDASDDDVADDDSGGDDDGDPVPDWSHCPGPGDAVGDPSWEGSIDVQEGALLCSFARMDEPLEDLAGRKQQLRFVPGVYRFPLLADSEPWFVLSCLWSPAEASSPVAGTVHAEIWDGMEGTVRAITGTFPLPDGTDLQLLLALDPDLRDLLLDGSPSTFDDGVQAVRCVGAECWQQDDALLLPCRMEPNICDRLELDRGWIALDEHHWAGNVGAGFAALMRARGEIDGHAFDVDSTWRLSMSYGHHAFTRGAEVMFGEPIGDVCGLRLGEVSDIGASAGTFQTLDCERHVNGALAFMGEEHTYHQGGCP